jgi:tetratricopeptide (TPR) repeat protein
VENVRNRSKECHNSLLVAAPESLILGATHGGHTSSRVLEDRVFESEHKLRHLPFFEEIASRNEGTPEWSAATAGIVVLRLVDAWIEDGPRVMATDDWGMRSVRSAIDEVRSNEKLRSILLSVVDLLETSTIVDMGKLAPRMMAYGQLLEYDATWTLAADVYASIIGHTHPVQEADIATQAHLRRGFCLRQMGDLPASLTAYVTAGEIAQSANDMVGVLRARIGEAKGAIARGNMPRAKEILDETIARASEHRLDDVRSMAMHDRSVVAHLTGEYELAIKIAYEALESTQSSRERDRILIDVASSFYKLGVHTAARDAYVIIASTAQEAYLRWFATLNLMEIAAVDGKELLFEQYRRSIDVGALPPQLAAHYWLQGGIGYEQLGNFSEAKTYLERAVTFAEEHELYQFVFDADSALRGLGSTERRHTSSPQPFAVKDEDVDSIANRLSVQRQEIGA